MNETYQVILIAAIVLIALNFFITRYYVLSTVEQHVDAAIDDKIRRANKKVMKAMKSTFEKYMGPGPRMIDPRVGQGDARMMERHQMMKQHRHRSSRHDEEDSIDDPAEVEDNDRDRDRYDEESLE